MLFLSICKLYIVTNTNFNMNNNAMIVIMISFFWYLPVTAERTTYAIAPIPIPFAIEYVSGIMISAKKAGTADVISSILTLAKLFIINTPT